ncbi:MAG: M48 family metallopeptidase [Lachnospiraceae bacterium]|nr:M48 family metallopeptidase [Lachnospiraceae bacterium]
MKEEEKMTTQDWYEQQGAPENNYVLSKKEIEGCRHKSEKRWYRGLCVLNVLILIVCIAVITVYTSKFVNKIGQEMKEITVEVEQEMEAQEQKEKNATDKKEENITKTDAKKTEKQNETEKKTNAIETDETTENEIMDEDEETLYMYAIMAIAMIFILPLALNVYYQKYRTMSIRITEKNFPEIYERVQLYAKRLDMKKVPEVYIIQQNGILNAFSSFIVRKQYIEIYADIFEVAYREHEDLDAISFILAHEMAHIKYKHATFGYTVKILYARLVPILASTASRAREYSCDRLAQKVTGVDGVDAMFSLIAGKHLYKMVDKEDYLEYAKGVKGFFVWWYNLLADHPVMTKRIPALEMKEGSGKLY